MLDSMMLVVEREGVIERPVLLCAEKYSKREREGEDSKIGVIVQKLGQSEKADVNCFITEIYTFCPTMASLSLPPHCMYTPTTDQGSRT